MTWFFTPHCRQRADERYGLKLTVKELSEMLIACRDGKAPIMRKRIDGGDTFCFEVRGVKTFPVVSPDGVIITFLPSDFFVASSAKKHRLEVMNSRGRPARDSRTTDEHLRREPYHRPKFKRELRSEIEGG